MHPHLIDLGRVTLPWLGEVHLALPSYGLAVATAVVVAWLWMVRRASRDGISAEAASGVAFYTLLGGLAGGKLGLLIVDAPYYLENPRAIVSMEFVRAAGVVWVAVLAGALSLVLAARHHRLPWGRLLDAAAVPLPVAQAIGRIGCLLAGCCYGSRCTLPWAVRYFSHEAHAQTGVPLGVSLHPAPAYEALWSLAVALPLTWLAARHRRHPGEAVLVYLACYGIGRFLVEFARGDAVRGLWFAGTLSTSQLISLLVAPLALGAWIALRRRRVVDAAGGPEAHDGAGAGRASPERADDV